MRTVLQAGGKPSKSTQQPLRAWQEGPVSSQNQSSSRAPGPHRALKGLDNAPQKDNQFEANHASLVNILAGTKSESSQWLMSDDHRIVTWLTSQAISKRNIHYKLQRICRFYATYSLQNGMQKLRAKICILQLSKTTN